MGQDLRSRIQMTADEIAVFLEQSRTATMATVGPAGRPHLVAMWYAWIGGQIWFESKAKAQKIVNLRRNPTMSVMVEAGHTYDTLRGVSLEGRGAVVADPGRLWQVGVGVWERYTGPYSEKHRPFVEAMLHKRVAVRLDVERARSWDHRKLAIPAMPIGGTTSRYLDGAGLEGPG